MSPHNLEELDVYRLAEDLSDEVWHLVSQWDYFAKDTIGKQLVRSCDSISANIAEGYGRYHYKENRNFCFFSRGSVLETKSRLRKAEARRLVTTEAHQILLTKLQLVHFRLNAYIKFIGKASAQ